MCVCWTCRWKEVISNTQIASSVLTRYRKSAAIPYWIGRIHNEICNAKHDMVDRIHHQLCVLKAPMRHVQLEEQRLLLLFVSFSLLFSTSSSSLLLSMMLCILHDKDVTMRICCAIWLFTQQLPHISIPQTNLANVAAITESNRLWKSYRAECTACLHFYDLCLVCDRMHRAPEQCADNTAAAAAA